jgi:hypothetical protein
MPEFPGATHIAQALAHLAIRAGAEARFTTDQTWGIT